MSKACAPVHRNIGSGEIGGDCGAIGGDSGTVKANVAETIDHMGPGDLRTVLVPVSGYQYLSDRIIWKPN